MTAFDVVVLGAGAAGLFAAMRAGQRGRRVLLLDHADEPGKKILISGGGRCNFTNTGCVPDRFISANRHFARSALARYTQHDFIALVRKHGIAFHEKTLGQLFCDGSARQIVQMLLAEAEAAGVDLRLRHRVTDITRADRFTITTDHGVFTAESLVLATGGLSIPKMGATGFAHDVARRFGLSDAAFNNLCAAYGGPCEPDPYALLNVDATATNDEVRKAYLKAVRENHPDRMMARGAPEEFLAVATEKLARINAAYDGIKAERGL